MTVRSATTDEPLADSGTDVNGDFLMSLPSSEETLVVDVAGFNSTTVARTQRGGGSLTAKLAVAASGDMRAEQVSEAQIESSSLCSGLIVSGNELVINGPLPQEACVLTLIAASQQLELETFVGSLRGNCAGAVSVVQSAWADQEGRVQLGLNRALSAECSDIRIEVSSPATQGLQHIFVVE